MIISRAKLDLMRYSVGGFFKKELVETKQLNMFELSEIDQKIDWVKNIIREGKRPYDLVAVNKYYQSAVIYDREKGALYYVNLYGEEIRENGTAPGYGGSFGPNYHLVDERFRKYESIELTNKKREYTTCPRYELDEYLKEGWFPE